MRHRKEMDKFYNYFDREIKKVAALDIPGMFKKILYTSIINALGQARYPKGSTYDRIVNFIYQYSGWCHKEKVSLIQLCHNLEFVLKEDSERKDSEIFDFVHREASSFQKGRVYRPDKDPLFGDVMGLARTEKESAAVRYARYVELFYTYRNTMVHEYREPGYGIEMSPDGSSPYYHSYINKPWATVFPVDVFRDVSRGCLNGLKEYLLERDVNPYEPYEFGFRWTQEKKFRKFRAKRK